MFVRKSNRLTKFDYSTPNYYFVTACTLNRAEYFGEVVDREMHLNAVGIIAQKFWISIPEHYSNVALDEFIVMPNHIHGILIIRPGSTIKAPSLPGIMSAYKNISGKQIRALGSNFSWQKSFYDHVIRKEESLDKIREYIRNNPLKWELDRNNPENLWM